MSSTHPDYSSESHSSDRPECHASPLNDDYAHCLVENPSRCPYALSFGYGFLRRHPDQSGIAAGRLRLVQPRDRTERTSKEIDKQLGGTA
jgi:hypothetical protein